MFVLDKYVLSLNRKKYIIFRRNLEAVLLNVRDAEGSRRKSVHTEAVRKREYTLIFHHLLTRSNVAKICRFRVGTQKIGKHCVFYDL